ncbi:hypothetical protein AB1Y20_010182 [Prymnesium parvum]|uniref:G-protein coupled receptors family 1 profile domain-containing protein n=1 Tax=Prymnesium parvum TaxID=97485 RepID=A0AB34K4B5_PRYPA
MAAPLLHALYNASEASPNAVNTFGPNAYDRQAVFFIMGHTPIWVFALTSFESVVSLISSLLLLLATASKQRRMPPHASDRALLSILFHIALSDIVFAACWLMAMVGFPLIRDAMNCGELCETLAVIGSSGVDAGFLACSFWTIILSWYLRHALSAQSLWGQRIHERYARWHCIFILGTWGVAVAIAIGAGSSGATSFNESTPSITLALCVIVEMFVPFGTTLFIFMKYLAVRRTFMPTDELLYSVEHDSSLVKRLNKRLLSYLAAYVVCQLPAALLTTISIWYSNKTLNPEDMDVRWSYWISWLMYAIQPLQGLADAVVFARHVVSPGHQPFSFFVGTAGCPSSRIQPVFASYATISEVSRSSKC